MCTTKYLAELYYELISQDHHKDWDCYVVTTERAKEILKEIE